MGRKGKRRRRPATQEGRALEPREERKPVRAEPVQEQPERPRGLFATAGLPSPYPPLGRTMAASFPKAARDPRILVIMFLFALAVWGAFTAIGAEPSPRVMVVFTALPPISTFFDAILTSSVVQGAVLALAIVVGMTLLRTVVLLTVIVLTHRAVDDPAEPPPGRRALAGMLGSIFAIQAVELGLVLAVPILVQAFLGPQVGVLAAWILGLYLLAMAPIIVAVERVGAAEALRRSFRAARLPGFRHTGLVMLYFAFVLWLTSITPTGPVPPATPTLVTWLITLGTAVVHVGFLAAFTYRWISVRGEVPSGPAKRSRTR